MREAGSFSHVCVVTTPGGTEQLATPQSGIFALGCSYHCYLEFDRTSTTSSADLVAAVCNLEVPRTTPSGANLVTGFRPSLWRQMEPDGVPHELEDFAEDLSGIDGYYMPATQRDLWVWVSAASYSDAFTLGRLVIEQLKKVASCVEDIFGWSHAQSRDLTGFIDGTANPNLLEAPNVAIIPNGSIGAGGSSLLFQKWRHRLEEFDQLSEKEQESVIGRTKREGDEFEEDDLPADSHVARTTLIEGERELPIFRRNSAYGTPTENGTVFIGFSSDVTRLTKMLDRMAGKQDGIRDALTRYTDALSGSYYFIPSNESIRKFADQVEFLT